MTSKVVGLLLAMLLAGCRHAPGPTGQSSFRVVEQPPDRTPPPKSDAKPVQPTSLEQYREASVQEKTIVLPVYPSRALAAKAGAAQVGVRIMVDDEGRVVDVRPSLLAITITPPGFRQDFELAVETAVRQWKFHPAKIQHVEIVTEKGFTYSRVTRTEMSEAEFDLAFTFTPSGKVEAGTSAK
jgi:hypothetical protein